MWQYSGSRPAAASPRSGLRPLPHRPRSPRPLAAVPSSAASLGFQPWPTAIAAASSSVTASKRPAGRGRRGSSRSPLRGAAAAGRAFTNVTASVHICNPQFTIVTRRVTDW